MAPLATAACGSPPAILASTQPNIFSDQQEQWLGDALADQVERNYRPLKDPALNAYVARITQRLLAALPPTKIQFRVVLLDSDQVNAFSMAGGRIYLFRKLVVNAKNEDEVASVIGHEMGHILTHQFAYQTTADLKRLLNITSVGDRADVYAKAQLLIDARMKDKHRSQNGNSDEGQDQADTVSMYAIAAAGYYPQAFADFWNRMFFVDGKVGGPLSDFFGVTKPQEKRLRGILKLASALPPGCGASKPADSDAFKQWQAEVEANQPAATKPDLATASAKPVAEVALTPPLRMNVERLRFSRDGRYILAQDESSVFVLTRDPYKPLFRFDAERALPAEFSPDSKHIVFSNRALHSEQWSIAEQKLTAVHDPVTRTGCIQSQISPDGRTQFCLAARQQSVFASTLLDLIVLDAASGDVLYKKEDFFKPTMEFAARLNTVTLRDAPADLMPSSFSADGNTILIGPSEDKMAFDLRSRAPIKISSGLVDTVKGAYAFIGNDKVIGIARSVGDSGVFSFPDGKRVQPAPFGLADLESVSGGNYVTSHNLKGFAVGLIDVSAAKFIAASKAGSIDVWDNMLLNENVDGSIVLHKLGDQTVADQTVMLPLSPLASSVAAIGSDDGRFLALSTRTRGGVWDLQTGERILQTLRFSNAVFAPDNSVYIEFPKQDKQARAIVHFSFAPFEATPVTYKLEETAHITHSGLQQWKPSDDKKSVELTVHDAKDNSVLWQRTFPEAQFGHTSSTIVPGEILAAFTLKSDFAKARMQANRALAAEADRVQNRDKAGVLQVLSSADGKVLDEVVLETPLDYEGLQGIHVVGDQLYLTGRANRTIVYSVATGAQVRQMFGTLIAADPGSGRVCLRNRAEEAVVYDAHGQQLGDFYMGSPLRYARFQGAGERLLLLTADQKVRTMAVAATAK